MRGWGKYTAAGMLAAGLTACAQAEPLSATECRGVWEDLRQTQGENGSIAPKGTASAARWQEEYAAAERRAKQPGDLDTCAEDVLDAAARFSALVDLGAAINRYDLAEQLRLAERDLRHAQGLGSFVELPSPLAEAFDQLRTAAAEVHDAVVVAEEAASEVDLEDDGDVEDLVEDIEDAATGTSSYEEGKRALEVIGRYELHEE